MKTKNAFMAVLIVLIAGAVWGKSAPLKDTPNVEEGRFYLHKFGQRIGEESYKITRGDQQMQLTADFKFTDRGREVPLTATLTMEPDMTPTSFHIKGMVSRFSPVEDSIPAIPLIVFRSARSNVYLPVTVESPGLSFTQGPKVPTA